MRLEPGTLLPLPGGQWRVRRWLGEGSQGSVWEVLDPRGTSMALKWYADHMARSEQRTAITKLIERGAPSAAFLWPKQMVELPGRPGFGYLMPLRPQEYVGLSGLLDGRVDAPFSVAVTVCLHLADSFLALHSEGLCYRDISFGNVFVEPASGRAMICDTDNVGVDDGLPGSVLGTRRFMAPEIVRGEASPSARTDLYSLAVLVFSVLMVGHPLLGRRELEFPCLDADAEQRLFGSDPVFVYDPVDESNRPVPEMHAAVQANWPLYPDFVRDLFVQAFTRGLRDPVNGRVRESVWRSAMARLRDGVVSCPSCRKENFADRGTPRSCWACGRDLGEPLVLVLDGRRLVLNDDTVVTRHHLFADYDLHTVLGRVSRHPERADVWGLRNLGEASWTVRLPGGRSAVVPSGGTATLVRGAEIDFGPVVGKVGDASRTG
jgi:DNA-binding helix-hairpin-helix protein with protein kinase domain